MTDVDSDVSGDDETPPAEETSAVKRPAVGAVVPIRNPEDEPFVFRFEVGPASVGAVHHVAAYLNGEIAANAAGVGFNRIGFANGLAAESHGIGTTPDHGYDRS